MLQNQDGKQWGNSLATLKEIDRVNTPPNIETAPAGIFLPLAVLLALGLINTDSSSSERKERQNG